MATPIILPSFSAGEAAPSLFGRVDTARYHASAATIRNMFVRYTGGVYSRAGTAFCGYSKQTGRAYPPRLIPFQFSIDQGFALEFGHLYMRVISNGGYITESGLPISAATKANPCVITMAATGASTATVNSGAVNASYAPGDTITLEGGVYSVPATLLVNTTDLIGGLILSAGSGYVPGDTITLTGGTVVTPPVITVVTTNVTSASVNAAGSGGTPGSATVTGTTGTGTKFQASVTIGSGGSISSVDAISLPGSYTVNPTSLSAEPVTGGGLTGATLSITMGVSTFSVTTPGVFSANGASLTQSATSGSGTGFSLTNVIYAPASVTVTNNGSYTSFPSNPVSQLSTSGSGSGATFNITTGSASAYSVGDWITVSGVGGMTELNGRTFVIGSVSGSQYGLKDVFGANIDSTSYGTFTSNGVGSRIYTLTTPYAETDIAYLKFTQSADVMSLCCVNQPAGVEYPPYDLSRFSDNNWALNVVTTDASVSPPSSVSVSSTSFPAGSSSSCYYQYVVSSVSPTDGSESVASAIAGKGPAVDIASVAGSVTVTWSSVSGISQYNVYKALPAYAPGTGGAVTPPPAGSLFGYVGSSYGTQFLDSNITADFSKVPPVHKNPFARGQVSSVSAVAGGSGYSTATATITTSTGSGASVTPVIVAGQVVSYIVQNPGRDYASTDTITITGNGSGATAKLNIGALTGTYPGCVAYFQQRRVYASTLNNPDTYFMSQPGAYKNFDHRIPTVDSDSITGTPWSQQVNGIQHMVAMPGGLVVLTGSQAWQLTGSGGSSLNPQPLTPSSQQAQPQAYNGCSATLPPVKIDYDIVYVQAKGSIYRDLSYNFYSNIYTGTDLTQNSSHLFNDHTIISHAWCEEPFKTLWAVRDDGAMLCMTFFKPENVFGWTRCDTYGQFVSNCTVTEPPVDALYVATKRRLNGKSSYMVERMDGREWNNVEEAWCVDCGLRSSQPTPAANLDISTPMGLGAISGVTNLIGGSGYSSATTATVVDENGQGDGTGAVLTLTISGGVITAITPSVQGTRYTRPAIVIDDPSGSGSGASADAVLDNSATFTASSSVFSLANVGSVIRAGGGIATITGYTSGTVVTANITTPIRDIVPNSVSSTNPDGEVRTQLQGQWTMTAPFTQIGGATHLAGAKVTGTADGNVLDPFVVPANGIITLPAPATAVTVGLGFQCQFQTVYLDAGEPTVQGQRKKIAAGTVRLEASRGVKVGSNQVDGSFLSPPAVAPQWNDMQVALDAVPAPYNSSTAPLYTADVRVPVVSGFNKPGQVALQQDNPLPMQILAVIPEVLSGDIPEQKAQDRRQRRDDNNQG